MKIKALFLAIILVLSFDFSAGATQDVKSNALDNVQYRNSFSFVSSLGIVNDSETDVERKVTRAEFANMIVTAMNYDVSEPKSGDFFDVTNTTPYSGAIYKAQELGIINGSGSGVFAPEDAITRDAAIKMAVCALGYEDIAIVKGGFPLGYLMVANELDILDGVSLNNELSFSDTTILIYNFLNADLCKITGIKNDSVYQMRDNDSCILSKYHHLKKTEGVMKVAGFESMVPDYDSDDAKISINGEFFDTSVEDITDYLGNMVTGWYDDNGHMNLIYKHTSNETITVQAEYVKGYDDFKLTVYNEDYTREITYNLNRAFTFVKNGRHLAQSDEDFVFPSGYLKLIDNDDDGKYDVVNAKCAELMVVSSVNLSSETVYSNKPTVNNVRFSTDYGYKYNLNLVDKKGILSSIKLKDLTSDMVLLLYRSNDGKYVDAVAYNNPISGTISEIGDDTIVIDDKEYKTNIFFTEKDKIAPGNHVTLLLAADGTVAALASTQSGILNYGYLLDFMSKKSGLFDKVFISLLTDAGEILETGISDTLILDGKKIKKNDSKLADTLLSGNIPKYQVIRYSLNDDGYISVLDTALDASNNSSIYEKYSSSDYGNDTLIAFFRNKRSFWHGGTGIFTPHVFLNDGGVIFKIPEEVASGATKRIDKKYFSVTNTGSLPAEAIYQIDAYDMDSVMCANVIVIYDTNASESMISVNENATQCVVENVTRGLNADGECLYITCLGGGNYYKYSIDTEVYDELSKRGNIPKTGDIIRVATDTYGDVKNISIDAKYDTTQKVAILTDNAPKDGQVYDSCYRGRVYSHNSSYLSLIDEQDFFSSSYSDPIVDGVVPFKLDTSVNVAIYDTKTNTTRHGRLNMLNDEKLIGEGNGSKVIIRCYSHRIMQIFIYE